MKLEETSTRTGPLVKTCYTETPVTHKPTNGIKLRKAINEEIGDDGVLLKNINTMLAVNVKLTGILFKILNTTNPDTLKEILGDTDYATILGNIQYMDNNPTDTDFAISKYGYNVLGYLHSIQTKITKIKRDINKGKPKYPTFLYRNGIVAIGDYTVSDTAEITPGIDVSNSVFKLDTGFTFNTLSDSIALFSNSTTTKNKGINLSIINGNKLVLDYNKDNVTFDYTFNQDEPYNITVEVNGVTAVATINDVTLPAADTSKPCNASITEVPVIANQDINLISISVSLPE